MMNGTMPRAQKRIDSDERILRAAAKVFGSLGYSQATLTAIAAEAGVSQGLVSQRFGSKENLLHEAFDQTQILSFYEDGSQHLPQAFYVLLDHLKQEVAENPEWFRFLCMIHTGADTPRSLEVHTKEMFLRTPLCSAIAEAQKQNDLPAGSPWDIFRVFFRNATNLISWYHEFGLPMPENESFLYAIQYSRRRKDAEAMISSQKHEISSLQTDRDILFTAVSDIYPLIVFCNLTQNSYYMLEYERFTTKRAEETGVYDDLIRVGASTIPSEIHREQFLRMFGRENVMQAFENGKQQLCLRHLQMGDDGITRWIETRMQFKGCACGEVLAVTLSRQIDNEMERLRCYGEALQNAELAAGAKSRFLMNLSHDTRTAMNAIIGYTELLSRWANEPEKVRSYAEKMHVAEEELMGQLSCALDAANLSPGSSGIEIKVNLNECSSGILASAQKIAAQRGVTLDYQIGMLQDDCVYTDEIRLQKCMMSLILNAINESVSGSSVQVKLEQLPDQPESQQDGKTSFRLSVHKEGVGMSDELLHRICDDDAAMEGIALNLAEIRKEILALGGTFDIRSQEDGNTVVCVIRFRRAE